MVEAITITPHDFNGIPALQLQSAALMQRPAPTVIFYHGWHGCKERVLAEAYAIAEHDIRVILPDAPLHGARQAEAPAANLDFFKVVGQTVAEFPQLVAALKQANLILADQIGVAGLSMGGITTTALLTQYPQIKAAVCLMGAADLTKFARNLISNLPQPLAIEDAVVEQQLAALQPFDLGLHPEALAGRPVHFWHDTTDPVVGYQFSHEFYNRHRDHAQLTFATTTGHGHRVPISAAKMMGTAFAADLRGEVDG